MELKDLENFYEVSEVEGVDVDNKIDFDLNNILSGT